MIGAVPDTPSSVGAAPNAFHQLVFPSDIRDQSNAFSTGVAGARSLWVTTRVGSPILLYTYLFGAPAPLMHLLHKARAPHYFQYSKPIDRLTLSLASLLGTTPSPYERSLPPEGSTLNLGGTTGAATHGDGFILLTGTDQPTAYVCPDLDTRPRWYRTYSGTIAAGTVAQVTLTTGAAILSAEGWDLYNTGTVPIQFAIFSVQRGGIGTLAGIETGGSIQGSDYQTLNPGAGKNLDIDLPPGDIPCLFINNPGGTAGTYDVEVWGI